jgi:hypothetical protein
MPSPSVTFATTWCMPGAGGAVHDSTAPVPTSRPSTDQRTSGAPPSSVAPTSNRCVAPVRTVIRLLTGSCAPITGYAPFTVTVTFAQA